MSGIKLPTATWELRALCRDDLVDPELFFSRAGRFAAAAKKICSRCPVKQECLAAAIRDDERFGVRGGLSEAERRQLHRRGCG